MVSLFFACESTTSLSNEKTDTISHLGEWNNFQQVWLENTDTDQHRIEVAQKHPQYHLAISAHPSHEDSLILEASEGRINLKKLGKQSIAKSAIQLKKDTLIIANATLLSQNTSPYRFLKCRMFSGWIQYPMSEFSDSIYANRDLVIHDQGGMAELQLNGVDYTVELTQLQFAKTIHIMKLAVYDMPIDSVGINSKSISYTWTTPEAKRLGINLRKVISGWTFIEPGYVNSNNLNKK